MMLFHTLFFLYFQMLQRFTPKTCCCNLSRCCRTTNIFEANFRVGSRMCNKAFHKSMHCHQRILLMHQKKLMGIVLNVLFAHRTLVWALDTFTLQPKPWARNCDKLYIEKKNHFWWQYQIPNTISISLHMLL